MKVNIEDLPEEGIIVDFSIDEQAVVDGIGQGIGEGPGEASKGRGSGFSLKAPLKAQATLTPAGEMIAVDGTFSTDLSIDCSRCLKRFDTTVTASFTVYFETVGEDDGEDDVAGEREISGDDAEVIPLTTEEIDMNRVVFEQLALELPFKPLCNTDCRGLCPQCGADLNDAPCQCKTEERIDRRLNALKSFKVKKKQ